MTAWVAEYYDDLDEWLNLRGRRETQYTRKEFERMPFGDYHGESGKVLRQVGELEQNAVLRWISAWFYCFLIFLSV
ncbi:hypothetical protein K505DRAFT_163477 [Melanomma pulvis-pyrius CBS 109.77]|uniref:Uncharacterized protein n=1 Tax=Melanomma pulvis-pyrius CBS 109.77 TaxID=1314802 RepID=A0A6A6WNU3_9PLEO|nr:hypothetical protein K505DRAFT_163477 [Melanomma pulvis-pyrius CBS 109.77]